MCYSGCMNAVISVIRPFHAALTANTLSQNGIDTTIYSSAPRRYFRGLGGQVATRLIPAPAAVFEKFFHTGVPPSTAQASTVMWDATVARLSPRADVAIGYATQALRTGRKAHRRGTRFLLDRACPYVDFQQRLVAEESERVGVSFVPQPSWYRERQLEEYALADAILVPSTYTASSFPQPLRGKLIKLPLLGRIKAIATQVAARNEIFTVGVVGGQSLRKGYLYLFEAWKKLALPQARLLVRCGEDFKRFPRLQQLLDQTPSIELVGYVPDMRSFYQQCDAFILPSVDDGFGMALFEAMSAGVASIATTNCGASEHLVSGVDGLVIAPRSVDAIATAIERLYRDDDLRRVLAVNGAARVAANQKANLYATALLGYLGRA